MNNVKSSTSWKKYEPNRRESPMAKYKTRFVVYLNKTKKSLYLSDMIIGKFVKPNWLSIAANGTLIGMAVADKETGFKVEYKATTTPSISVASFIKQMEVELKREIQPGIYECYVERIDAQTPQAFDMIIFDTKDPPVQVGSNHNNGHHDE
jgi:hypothetical protein